MTVKSVINRGNLGSAQSDDNYSPGLWADCPLQLILEGELPGVVFEDNFDIMPKTPATTEGNFGKWTQFSDTGGTVDPATGGHGWALGSDGDNEGASIRGRTTPFQIDRAFKKLWFEMAIKTSTIADTKHNILAGLIEDAAFSATVPITAAGAIADKNLVGFRRTEAALGGALLDTCYKADGVTAVTVQAGGITLVADTYVKIGMTFEPSVDPFLQDPTLLVGKYNLFFYNNGIRLATAKQIPSAQGTDFPNDVKLSPFFSVLNATGTTPGTSSIRRCRVVQLF